ncbi:MAG: transporter substrate-binding domain-containing protein [Kiritimatiellae bacterium]|nr:transporter substrate-binding domain-containing protein [Kiritimatiellia bacterium]
MEFGWTSRCWTALRRAALCGALAACGAAARAETVSVADCERDAARDYWAAADVEFCRNIMDEVFALAGAEPVRAEFDGEGMMVASNAEVVCSAFRTPALLEAYDFPLQPLGRMHYGLYAAPARAESMKSTKITDWPRMKVAYSPVSQGQRGNPDRENYFRHANLSPEYVEYSTSAGAVAALEKGEADALFLYTPAGKRPEGLEEIVPIGMRNVYFAVRKDRPELLERLSAAYREWYIDNIGKYDRWQEELLGVPAPEKRVRIAAYVRGELFRVTPDGQRSGRLEEWLRSLCASAHWTPDYVYGSFAQSVADVQEGRLDLLGGLSFTPERGEQLLYPHTACGVLRIYLWAHRKSPYKAGKPETWEGMKVGLLEGTHSGRIVKGRVAKDYPGIELREYAMERAMMDDFASGAIDACVNVEMRELAKERALRLYSAAQMYFVCARGKEEVFDELERALDEIRDDYPKYLRLVSEHHYGAHSGMSELGISETEWLAKRLKDPTPVVIDFSPWPFAVKDEKGRPEGFPKALLDELSRRTGLHFEAAPQTGIQTAEAKFLRGDTQFWVPYPEVADAASYEAVKVFSGPVPEHCAEAYGAADPGIEFEVLTHPGTPDELLSILRKTLSGIPPDQFQEMFMEAVAGRKAERQFFGLSEEELKERALFWGLGILSLVAAYGLVMSRLLKKHARRAEENAIKASELAAAKTKFLAMMSHELRTPLNAVIGFAEFLSRGDTDERHRQEYTQGILTSANALLALINDILDFSKLDAGAMDMREGECDVERVVSELKAIFGYIVRTRGVRFSVRRTTGDPVPPLKLSSQGLRRILINLVGNSSKFTKTGEIAVEYGWNPETKALRVAVRDTGCGISESKMKQLFDPFVQDIGSRMKEAGGETQGTGLGLPIVKRLVDNAGGKIFVETEVGRGTWTLIEIPGVEPAAEHPGKAPAAPAAERPLRVPESVLVVDDMSMNRKILGIHLKNLGVKDIRFAENGVQALEAMREWTPDAVLSDMWMPEMDGQRLSEAMHADPRLAAVPIVAVTADVDVDSTYDMNLFARVLAKPVTGEKLRVLFREL